MTLLGERSDDDITLVLDYLMDEAQKKFPGCEPESDYYKKIGENNIDEPNFVIRFTAFPNTTYEPFRKKLAGDFSDAKAVMRFIGPGGSRNQNTVSFRVIGDATALAANLRQKYAGRGVER